MAGREVAELRSADTDAEIGPVCPAEEGLVHLQFAAAMATRDASWRRRRPGAHASGPSSPTRREPEGSSAGYASRRALLHCRGPFPRRIGVVGVIVRADCLLPVALGTGGRSHGRPGCRHLRPSAAAVLPRSKRLHCYRARSVLGPGAVPGSLGPQAAGYLSRRFGGVGAVSERHHCVNAGVVRNRDWRNWGRLRLAGDVGLLPV